MDELTKSAKIASTGLRAQATRLRVVSENMANADSLPRTAESLPYRRKVVMFKNVLDRATDSNIVKVDRVDVDRSDFNKKFDPKHPAADRDGYVLSPNVNPLLEIMDMREAQRSYEANLNVINTSKAMLQRTVEMLR
jgi:flagellar basal-body rod protein FlgC